MASASGLSENHRRIARRIVAEGCALLLSNPSQVHYTQGPARFGAIRAGKHLHGRVFPIAEDCSSTATWLLWLALHRHFGIERDIVNGSHWRAGFTGTIAEHGKPVRKDSNIRVGDLVLYGSGYPYEHVAVALGGGKVFSHGSERGPFKLGIDYRPDRRMVRRFI